MDRRCRIFGPVLLAFAYTISLRGQPSIQEVSFPNIKKVTISHENEDYVVVSHRPGPFPTYLLPSDCTVRIQLNDKIADILVLVPQSGNTVNAFRDKDNKDSSCFVFNLESRKEDTLKWRSNVLAVFHYSPIVDSIKIVAETPTLNEEVSLKIHPLEQKPLGVLLLDLNGQGPTLSPGDYDTAAQSYSVKGRLSKQPRDYVVRILAAPHQSPFIEYDKKDRLAKPTWFLDCLLEQKDFLPAVKSSIYLRLPGKDSSRVIPIGNQVDVEYSFDVKGSNWQAVEKYLRELKEAPVDIYRHGGILLAQLSARRPGVFMLKLMNVTDPGIEGYCYFEFLVKDRLEKERVIVSLQLAGTPILRLKKLKSLYPGEKVVVEATADPSILKIFTLVSLGGEITLSPDSGRSSYSGTPPVAIPSGDYELYWSRRDKPTPIRDQDKAGFTVSIKEFSRLRRVASYARFSIIGGNARLDAKVSPRDDLKKLTISFDFDSLGNSQGPQFLKLTVKEIDTKGSATVLRDRKIITYNTKDPRGSDDGPYVSYLRSLFPALGKNVPTSTSVDVFPDTVALHDWSIITVQLSPDWDNYQGQMDAANVVEQYYKVKGFPLTVNMVVGVPVYLAYFGANEEADTLKFVFTPISAEFVVSPMIKGKKFFVTAGLGLVGFTASKTGKDTANSGYALSVPLSIDVLQFFRFFDWASMPDIAKFSISLSYILPLGFKTSYDQMPFGSAYKRWMFGFSAGVSF